MKTRLSTIADFSKKLTSFTTWAKNVMMKKILLIKSAESCRLKRISKKRIKNLVIRLQLRRRRFFHLWIISQWSNLIFFSLKAWNQKEIL